MIDKQKIKVILFDLDGTIYQDTVFHRKYIEILLTDTPFQNMTSRMIEYADEVLAGQHLKMNRFYQDKILSITDFADYTEQLENLLLADMKETDYYHGNREGCYYLGDAWSVVTLFGKTLGIQSERGNLAFLAIREEMMTENLPQNSKLIAAVSNLKHKYKTILLSNSPEKTASDFVKKLGFENAFGEMRFESNKPLGLNEKLNELAPEVFENPEILLSIGDHALNEIANVRELGGQTIWMNPYPGICEPEHDLKLKNLDELAVYLNTL